MHFLHQRKFIIQTNYNEYHITNINLDKNLAILLGQFIALQAFNALKEKCLRYFQHLQFLDTSTIVFLIISIIHMYVSIQICTRLHR